MMKALRYFPRIKQYIGLYFTGKFKILGQYWLSFNYLKYFLTTNFIIFGRYY